MDHAEELQSRSDVSDMPDCANCGHPFANHRTSWGTEMTCDAENADEFEQIFIYVGLCGCSKYVSMTAADIAEENANLAQGDV